MAAALSGQKTVTSAGTAVAFGTQQIDGSLMIKALDTNTDVVAIGNDGANNVTTANGLRLLAGQAHVFQHVGNLGNLWLNSAVSGEGVSWIKMVSSP